MKASQRAYNEMQTSIGPEVADAQIKLWNSQSDLSDAQKIKTTEEYNQLVAFMALRKENLRLTNDQIRKAMQVDDATISHLNSLGSFYDARTQNDYSPRAVELREVLMENQGSYYRALSQITDDRRIDPRKYKTKSTVIGLGPFKGGFTETGY